MITTLALTLILGVLDVPDAPARVTFMERALLGGLDVPGPDDKTYPATICRRVRILEARKGGTNDFEYRYMAYKICWAADVSWEELCVQLKEAYQTHRRGTKICAALKEFLPPQPKR